MQRNNQAQLAKPQLIRVIILSVMVVVLITGCAISGEQALEGDPMRGETIYRTGGSAELPCSTCHSLDGTKLVGPSFEGITGRAASRVPGLIAESYIVESITQPSAYTVEGFEDLMPSIFSEKLDEQEIEDLVVFLLTQTP